MKYFFEAGMGSIPVFLCQELPLKHPKRMRSPMPSQFLIILPYVATIIAVAGLVGRVRGPAADGLPYVKEGH